MLGSLFLALLPASYLEAAEQPEQALRARVEEYYSLLQQARWSEAEAYVAQDSRETFRNLSKKPFLSFRVKSFDIESEKARATAVVEVQVVAMPSPQPIWIPQSTHWRLVEGAWYVEMPRAEGDRLSALFASQKKNETPPPEELRFEGHRYHLGLVKPGELKVARFPFTNVTDHVVTLADVVTGCACLKVLTEKRKYQPGESGQLTIQFDPTGYTYQYGQTVIVTTDPGGLKTKLTITADLMPQSR
jgi:hypothetical protein